MSQAAIILLDQARISRKKAQRARRLAKDLGSEDVVQRLLAYAKLLEASAKQFEERAGTFQTTIDRTRTLTGEINELTAEATRRVQELRDKLTPK